MTDLSESESSERSSFLFFVFLALLYVDVGAQAEVTGVLRPSIALDSTSTTDESSDSLINHKQS